MGERISLWPVAAEDGEEFVALARDSANMHRGLIFAPTEATEFAEYLDRFDGVNAVGFVVRVNATRQLAGLVNINQIERKAPDPRGSLGYGGFAATSGHGYVAEAVRLAVPYAFEELGLSRLDAYIQPAERALPPGGRGGRVPPGVLGPEDHPRGREVAGTRTVDPDQR